MGYRSTFITNDFYDKIPEWFSEKWGSQFNFGDQEDDSSVISSRWERKYYSLQEDPLFEDISKIVRELELGYAITGALVHEDGEISRVIISEDQVIVEHLTNKGAKNWQLGEGGTKEMENK